MATEGQFWPACRTETPLDIVLLTPKRRFIANQYGLGYQVPLGLLCVGGPLIDAGHRVRFIDNDLEGLSDDELVTRLSAKPPDCVFVGHTGSTAAHPCAVETIRAIKRALPDTHVAYGGVYPTYAARTVMQAVPEIDVVVRGEGEVTGVELMEALSGHRPIDTIQGVVWRNGDQIISNRPRPAMQNLDDFRIAYELVDFDDYPLFGFGGAAGTYLSRGCTLRCSYCGQWSFWQKWRHRSPRRFVDEIEQLATQRGVRMVWLADENFAADRTVVREVLKLLVERDLGVSLNLNMTAADVVRDADIMHLYKAAGIDHIVIGIETLSDPTVARIGKNNPQAVSREAVRVMRRHKILSLVNVIYGLEDESVRSLWRTYRGLIRLDPNVVNAVYLTPHFWTVEGRKVDARDVIQDDQALFTYRNQVIATKIPPWLLFLGVKLTEALFHIRPRALWRLLFERDGRLRRLLRQYIRVGLGVWRAEWQEFFRTRFVRGLTRVPSYPTASVHRRGRMRSIVGEAPLEGVASRE